MLVVREEHSLRALLRALISAKFSPDVADRDVPASPFVAELARETSRVLEELEVRRDGPAAAERWATWRDLGGRRQEWGAAVKFAVESFGDHWSGWSAEDRERIVGDLCSPYVLSGTDYVRFVREVEQGLERDA